MENCNSLTRELIDLILSYRVGTTELNSLSFKSEVLVEKLRLCLLAEDFSRAMNCVYVIEEINAVVLDENRQPKQPEQDEIERQLALLEKLVSR